MAGEIFSGAVQVSLFMAAEIVGEFEVSLFVADAMFGEVQMLECHLSGQDSVKFGMIAGARSHFGSSHFGSSGSRLKAQVARATLPPRLPGPCFRSL